MENPPSISPELAQSMAQKGDSDLLAMLDAPDDWRPDVLEAVRSELAKRQIDPALHKAQAEAEASAATPSDTEFEAEEAPAVPEPPAVREGTMCAQHSSVQATQQCRKCGGFMCEVCDFAFPRNLHFCPVCIGKSEDGVSARQRKLMIWSYALAGWSTFGMACLVSGAMSGMARTPAGASILGWILFIFVLFPAIGGLSLGSTAKRPQGPNPTTLWIAIIWNAVLVALFLVLMVVGLFKE